MEGWREREREVESLRQRNGGRERERDRERAMERDMEKWRKRWRDGAIRVGGMDRKRQRDEERKMEREKDGRMERWRGGNREIKTEREKERAHPFFTRPKSNDICL